MAQLTPRYDRTPVLTLDGDPSAILEPAVRQRQRLLDTVRRFSDEEWRHQSRCDAWSSRDVIAHLDSTNGFWTASITAGCSGSPTRYLASFDPVATPAQLVDATAAMSNGDVLDRFASSTAALADRLTSLDEEDWSAIAEAPPGHIRVCDVVHHALWDSWVHERDILLPLGIEPERRDDEITACLRYAIALTPSFALTPHETRRGTISIAVTDPDIVATAHVDGPAGLVSVRARRGDDADVVLVGDAVEVLEALSIRSPLTTSVAADAAWLMSGLAVVFDVADR